MKFNQSSIIQLHSNNLTPNMSLALDSIFITDVTLLLIHGVYLPRFVI